MKNQNFQFVSMADDCIANHELKAAVSESLSEFFDSVATTVADYFEEATVKSI